MYLTLNDRKTLNEVYKNIPFSSRIFYALQMNPHGNILPWQRAIPHEQLDNIYFMIHSGDKIISKIVEYYANLSGGYLDNTQNQALCLNVHDFFYRKWVELYNTMFYEYDPISNYDMTETETINNTSNDSGTGTRTETPQGSESTTTDYTGKEQDKLTKAGEEENKLVYSGTEKDRLTKYGEEEHRTEYNGIETVTTTPTGREIVTTVYEGDEINTYGGTKTSTKNFTPTGAESEVTTNTETYNNVTDTATEWGFNSDLEFAPTPQNTNVKTGSTATNNSLTRSYIGRTDTTTDVLSFDDYEERKGFSSREDTVTTEYDSKEEVQEKEFSGRDDTLTISYTGRYDENEKTFTNREDTTTTTYRNRTDTSEKSFDERQDKTTLSFSEDRQTIIDTTDNLTRSSIVSRTLKRSGNIGVTTSQQMIQAQRELLLWDYFYKVVFPDLDNFLTLQIYR